MWSSNESNTFSFAPFMYLFIFVQMKILTPQFWIKLHPGEGCYGLCVRIMINPRLQFFFFFFFISSLAVEIDLNVNERPAESSRQQRWIGSHVDFNLG